MLLIQIIDNSVNVNLHLDKVVDTVNCEHKEFFYQELRTMYHNILFV